MNNRFDRSKLLLGERFDKLITSSVLIVGVGGVGGYAVEILARAGVGSLTLVDGDTVDITNINRQIIALTETVGKFKCDVFSRRVYGINPDCKLTVHNYRLNVDTINNIFDKHYDYVIDAIDSVNDKLTLIKYCNDKGIPIISAMGAGNRIQAIDFEITDIFKTSHDGLSKKMRKLLKAEGITKHTVVATNTQPLKTDGNTVGSISFVPAMAGIKMGAYVINELIK